MVHMGHTSKEAWSIGDLAAELGVERKTLRRWVVDGLIPEPKPGIRDGRLVKCWSEKETEKIRAFHAKHYGGKGMDRRKGSRVEQKSSKE